jgi:hypothetical protein
VDLQAKKKQPKGRDERSLKTKKSTNKHLCSPLPLTSVELIKDAHVAP